MPIPLLTSLVAAALAVLTLTGCDLASGQPAATGPTPPAVQVQPGDRASAARALTRLEDARPRRGGYERTRDFGPAWSFDADHNGCRQRDDVLRRDLRRVRLRNRCTVVSGILLDPYTGRTVKFRKEYADRVQIDHVFPLAAAWAHGARTWTAERRLRFANDSLNLLATSAEANQRKGDDTPAEWQPRRSAWCGYSVRYIRVAARYQLTVSPADRRALTRMLRTCPR